MKKAYVFAGIAIVFWSTMAVVTKLLLGDLNSIQLLWISSFFAAAFLLVVNTVTGNIKKMKAYKLKDYIITVLIGLPGTLLYYLFYYAGNERMSASQALIVNYMWPIMSIVFACIILKEKLTLRKGIAVAVSFFGVVIVTGGQLLQLDQDVLFGALMCLLGAVFYGLFTALNQKVLYDKRISMMMAFFATFIITGIMNAINGDLFLPDPVTAVGVAWNGIGTMAVAKTLWILALEKGETAKISNLAYITPFLSLVWTSLILKEEITANSIIGLVVIVLGVLIQLKDKPKHKTAAVSK